MKYANEMDAVFLEEIKSSSHRFKQITTRSKCTCSLCFINRSSYMVLHNRAKKAADDRMVRSLVFK